MILFIGTEQAGFFISEVAKAKQIPIRITGLVTSLENIQNLALQEKYDFIVINIDMLTDSSKEIAETINNIHISTTSRIIILAQGYGTNSEIVQELCSVGITNFLTSNNLSKIKEQLETALNGIDDISFTKEHSPNQIPLSPKPLNPNNNYKTIAVVGSVGRIGTTTQCIQMVKYLNIQNKKACYIEMNPNGYLELLKEFYDEGVTIDEQLGKITYQNVDMFYKKDKISDILKLGYDYYIYDFGIYRPDDFALISFLEKNIKFVVCGTKPNELLYMQQALQVFYDNDVNYIFSFSPESEHEDVLALMEEKAECTYFATFTPDLFFYSSNGNPVWNRVFKHETQQPVNEVPEKRKNYFWGRKRK